ncbi:MAG: indolepyruvate ferredoxin oxidoreductase subunit alpha, partial [Clostridiaceae bacterium]|nr:indolepyruvate ferredoxin oxidoreductase subunit alpha [Clostridiaceae bacterium]
MKQLMTGNEAIARGAYEAGIRFASAYPGTPSTEILENIASYKDDIVAEWAPNEKVALEAVIGYFIAGGRAIASMKQVGLNVAADPLFCFSYTGANGSAVIITADEPGIHSSQTEQDNRYYAKMAKLPMFEPTDSQQAKDMVIAACEISEKYRTPVIIRMTTRVCHSKSIVELGSRRNVLNKEYKKDIWQYTTMPAVSRKLRIKLEERIKGLTEEANNSPFNDVEWNDKSIGIIASGIAYQYAKEVFGKEASYLRLGFSYPFPMDLIKTFASQVDTLYVIEEVEPYLEEQIRAAGIECHGKLLLPSIGELSPKIIDEAIRGVRKEILPVQPDKVTNRPPVLCPGCAHRAIFYELSRRKDLFISGDIGCYGLGALPPLNAMDTCICMGASVSAGHGVAKAFKEYGVDKHVISVIGDSTFFHSGMTSLLNVVYNKSKTITVILDNRITGMTGHQDHPGTGYTAQGEETQEADIEKIVKALGVNHVKTINPLRLNELHEAIDNALEIYEPSVIIARWPCALKKLSAKDKEEFGEYEKKYIVKEELCIGCKKCIRTGCPAL